MPSGHYVDRPNLSPMQCRRQAVHEERRRLSEREGGPTKSPGNPLRISEKPICFGAANLAPLRGRPHRRISIRLGAPEWRGQRQLPRPIRGAGYRPCQPRINSRIELLPSLFFSGFSLRISLISGRLLLGLQGSVALSLVSFGSS